MLRIWGKRRQGTGGSADETPQCSCYGRGYDVDGGGGVLSNQVVLIFIITNKDLNRLASFGVVVMELFQAKPKKAHLAARSTFSAAETTPLLRPNISHRLSFIQFRRKIVHAHHQQARVIYTRITLIYTNHGTTAHFGGASFLSAS
jgi:hypothetical protein